MVKVHRCGRPTCKQQIGHHTIASCLATSSTSGARKRTRESHSRAAGVFSSFLTDVASRTSAKCSCHHSSRAGRQRERAVSKLDRCGVFSVSLRRSCEHFGKRSQHRHSEPSQEALWGSRHRLSSRSLSSAVFETRQNHQMRPAPEPHTR